MTIQTPVAIKYAERYPSNTSDVAAAYTALRQARAPHTLPCSVTLTRVSPRPIDRLPDACVNVAQAVALWLQAEADDPRIVWRYAQIKGGTKEYGCEILIEPND